MKLKTYKIKKYKSKKYGGNLTKCIRLKLNEPIIEKDDKIQDCNYYYFEEYDKNGKILKFAWRNPILKYKQKTCKRTNLKNEKKLCLERQKKLIFPKIEQTKSQSRKQSQSQTKKQSHSQSKKQSRSQTRKKSLYTIYEDETIDETKKRLQEKKRAEIEKLILIEKERQKYLDKLERSSKRLSKKTPSSQRSDLWDIAPMSDPDYDPNR